MSPEDFLTQHRAKMRDCMKRLRAIRKAAKLCIGCGGPRGGHVRCKTCRSKIARQKQASRKVT